MIKTKDIKLKPAIGRWFEYKKVKKYNTNFVFKNIDQHIINDLLNINFQFGEKLIDILKENLNFAVELYEVVINQQKYSEFLDEHRSRYASAIVSTAENIGISFILEYQLVQTMLNRITGGPGLWTEGEKQLTEIEEIAFSTLLTEMINLYQQYWLGVLKLDMHKICLESPQIKINDKIKRTDEVVSITLNFALGEQAPAEFTILLASADFEKIMENYLEALKKKPRKITVRLLPQSVTNVDVPIEVKLGTTTVNMSDILSLKSGDVFQLNEKLNDNVVLKIGNEAEFLCHLGRHRDNYSVRILEQKNKFYRLAPAVEEEPQAALEIEEPAATEEMGEASTELEEMENLEPTEDSLDEQQVETEVEEEFEEAEEAAQDAAQPEETTDSLLEEFKEEKDEADDEFVWDIDDL